MIQAQPERLGAPAAWARRILDPLRESRLLLFYAGVVAIQTIHVAEHVIQLVQVYLLGVPDDLALGILGFFLQLQGTEEWLHFAFNGLYLSGLIVIAVGLARWPAASAAIGGVAMLAFLVFGLWLEGWHVVEHVVIISNVLANDGCPCPGILDARLGVSDTLLHFVYNAIAYVATAAPLFLVLRRLRPGR